MRVFLASERAASEAPSVVVKGGAGVREVEDDPLDDPQLLVFQHALREVPKSGEVWCEGARIHMNPMSKHFSLTSAARYNTIHRYPSI